MNSFFLARMIESGENRIAKIIDSPYHPYSEERFTINEKGTDNIDEGKSDLPTLFLPTLNLIHV
jgi:hypothetical protein